MQQTGWVENLPGKARLEWPIYLVKNDLLGQPRGSWLSFCPSELRLAKKASCSADYERVRVEG